MFSNQPNISVDDSIVSDDIMISYQSIFSRLLQIQSYKCTCRIPQYFDRQH